MAAHHLAEAARLLTRRLGPDDRPDGQLLGRFLDHADADALEALVRRHGPMVLGVCRRTLGDGPDADDAFQATFLVLVRKANSVRPRDRVGQFLYGVARTTAVRAKAACAKRLTREGPLVETPDPRAVEPADDRLALLDVELAELPEKYRLPIVRCELGGRSHAAAAEHLGWPVGTLSGRLSRGRKLLADRLARRGLTAGVVAVGVPEALTSATVRAATGGAASGWVLTLTEGVLKAMLMSKLKVGTAGLLVALACVGGGAVAILPSAAGQPKPVAKQDKDEKKEPTAAPAAAGKNVLRNGGFEEGDKTPAHWTQGNAVPEVEYVWDKKVGQKGTASLGFHKTANRYFPIAEWSQTVDRTGDLPALRVVAQVKAEKVTKAILDVQFLDGDGQVTHKWAAYIGAKEADDPPVSHDWKEYAGRVDIPPGTKKLCVGLQIYGPGQVWFDEVRAEYEK